MIMATRRHTPHASDGDLVRWLDGEADAAERSRTHAHVAMCDACAERLEMFRRRSARLSTLLTETDAPLPALSPPLGPVERGRARERRFRVPRPTASGWLRAAAVVLLVAAVALSVDPVRAWVVDRWTDLEAAFTEDAGVPAPIPVPASESTGGAVVSFVPTGEVFRLTFDHPQAGGELVLRVEDGAQASVQIVDGAGEMLLVLPGGVRVHNSAASTADYSVRVPAGLEAVRVRIGGGAAVTYPVGAPGAARRLTIDLAAGS